MWLRHEKNLLLTKIVIFPVPRECSMCGHEVAQYECKKCYEIGLLKDGPGIASYCKGCHEKMHGHRKRQDHQPKPILLPRAHSLLSNEKKTVERQITIDKQKMDLFAVVCIETSHYVAFVKCGKDKKAPWCFFDSMADRKGESELVTGYVGHPFTFCVRFVCLWREGKFIKITRDQRQVTTWQKLWEVMLIVLISIVRLKFRFQLFSSPNYIPFLIIIFVFTVV